MLTLDRYKGLETDICRKRLCLPKHNILQNSTLILVGD